MDILGVDGILYKGRMNNQDRARPLTSVEELAGERQAFLGTTAWCPGFTGQCEGMQAGPTAGTISDWGGSSHSHLQKMGSYYMPGTVPGARETEGSKNMSCSPGVSTGVGEADCKQITKGEDKQLTWRALVQEQLVAKDTGLGRGAAALPKMRVYLQCRD